MITYVEKEDLDARDARLASLAERIEKLEAQPGRSERVIFAPVPLIGPVPGDGIVVPASRDWDFLTAVTASTSLFDFALPFASAVMARWILVWIPGPLSSGASAARLVAFNYDENNKKIETELAQISSKGDTGPVPQGEFFTDQLNALIKSGRYHHIGCQFKANGPWRIYKSGLEIHWRV